MQKIKLELDDLAVESFETNYSAIPQAEKTFSMLSCFVCDWLTEFIC